MEEQIFPNETMKFKSKEQDRQDTMNKQISKISTQQGSISTVSHHSKHKGKED